MTGPLFGALTGLSAIPATPRSGAPLVVAIHGGTYTARYFDVPGHSLCDRARAAAIPFLAPDRPGYGGSPRLAPEASTISGQAAHLTDALHDAWTRYGDGCRGMVLIGHSIGAAIAATIAAAPSGLPLIGVALSGVGLRVAEGDAERWAALPDVPLVDVPRAVKDVVMFGPAGSFDAAVVDASAVAHAPANRAELIDITGGWPGRVRSVLRAIAVPVHYRQAEFDRLWIVDEPEIDGFAAALSSAARVDAAMVRGTGHCIDFHHAGVALQRDQLDFARRCAAEA